MRVTDTEEAVNSFPKSSCKYFKVTGGNIICYSTFADLLCQNNSPNLRIVYNYHAEEADC